MNAKMLSLVQEMNEGKRVNLPNAVRLFIAARQSYRCGLCIDNHLLSDTWDIDHIIPISHELGTNEMSNLVALCPIAHARKTRSEYHFDLYKEIFQRPAPISLLPRQYWPKHEQDKLRARERTGQPNYLLHKEKKTLSCGQSVTIEVFGKEPDTPSRFRYTAKKTGVDKLRL